MDSTQLLSLLLVALLLAVVFGLLALGWRARLRRQAGLVAPREVPTDLGETLVTDDALYVATTSAESPTDRIAIDGLAFRGRAYLTVATRGILISIAGAEDVFIPRSAVVGAGRATWTIDRVVGRDGLVFVRWTLGDTLVDTNVRSEQPDALLAALQTLTPTPKGAS